MIKGIEKEQLLKAIDAAKKDAESLLYYVRYMRRYMVYKKDVSTVNKAVSNIRAVQGGLNDLGNRVKKYG